jgi:hypothetical protein
LWSESPKPMKYNTMRQPTARRRLASSWFFPAAFLAVTKRAASQAVKLCNASALRALCK